MTPASMLTPNMEERANPVTARPILSLRPILLKQEHPVTLYYTDLYLDIRETNDTQTLSRLKKEMTHEDF